MLLSLFSYIIMPRMTLTNQAISPGTQVDLPCLENEITWPFNKLIEAQVPCHGIIISQHEFS
jgi:hypothetical protein